MTTLPLATAAFALYPETSVFDFDIQPLNLTPPFYVTLEAQNDTPGFRAAALAQALQHDMNPLHGCYGTNPFSMHPRTKETDAPLPACSPAPPLPQLPFDDNFTLIEHINPTGNVMMLVIKYEGELRLLKFQQFDRYTVGKRKLLRFDTEKAAYEQLLHRGVCDIGIVPRCYGWVELKSEHMPMIEKQLHTDWDWDRNGLPKGLLLEYFADAVPVSISNVTIFLAEKAMMALCQIHAAFIKHNDIARRNCLLLPDGRVIWVDFDTCLFPDLGVRRVDFWEELRIAWQFFYTCLLPNQRIGYHDPLVP
ncbi:unnamed protein product [Somion occarium]|uniref:Protein kinase domain-containing protein n=1 Tax=Somion occarium TaxID=3059160 RepID=A0ABP1E3W6_9APHY